MDLWPSGGMVDTGDLKSLAQKWACEFESRLGYQGFTDAFLNKQNYVEVVKLANTTGLSPVSCGFESRSRYKMSVILDKTHQNVLNNGHFSLWPCSPIGRGISFKHCTVRVRIPMGLQPIHEGRLNDIGKDN
jgi:hypothetical protein